MTGKFRIEKDSLGEVRVPISALYGPQTQRAVNNFPISGIRLPHPLIRAMGQIKRVAAEVNADLGLLPRAAAGVIVSAADEVIAGKLESSFPVDIFQTGSGTSSNMNVNEVISRRAMQLPEAAELEIHPIDQVNLGQSSNDVFPTAIRIAAVVECRERLLGSLKALEKALTDTGDRFKNTVKTGRTHLMDAMPITFGQEFGGYARQISLGCQRIESALARVLELPIGGTAVGTGVNTHFEFPGRFIAGLTVLTGHPFTEAVDHFEAQSTVDALVELSSQLKLVALGMLKIANDLRWMNSGPTAGLAEIELTAHQPGSSIMPGKVNPVIEESVAMVCVQIIGFDQAITFAGLSGNFELNVMMPLVGFNLLESIRLLSNAARNWAEKSVSTLRVREDHVTELVSRNPILLTAISPEIGYDLAAEIVKKAREQQRPILDVAGEMTSIPAGRLRTALSPMSLTKRGFSR